MARQFKIRLGSVEAAYSDREGLSLEAVHEDQDALVICNADLPDLVDFICRHHRAARDTSCPPSSTVKPPEPK